ncbi:MAG: c-type cytochrome biogenesis protein CcsB [Candidatus Sumerlaeaceae bacterium]|nr:c-type cytochrome biogenesis protein CcsB [Candidatus Sumerlaeaceae bacterium]
MRRRMILPRCLFAAAVLTLAAAAPAQYYAKTGRTETVEVHSGAGTGIAPGETTSTAFVPVEPAALYYPAVDEALAKSGIDSIAVQSEGIAHTLRTFAAIKVNAITGKPSFEKQDPLFTLLGMIYQNKQWVKCPIIPVENPKLAEVFGLQPHRNLRVAPVWVMKTPNVRNLVLAGMAGGNEVEAKLDETTKKALEKFRFRLISFINLPGDFRIAPVGDEAGNWVSPSMIEHPETAPDEAIAQRLQMADTKAEPWASVLALNAALKKAYDDKDPADVASTTKWMVERLGDMPAYMPDHLRALDHINTVWHPFGKASLLYGISFFIFLAYLWTVKQGPRKLKLAAAGTTAPSPVTGSSPALAMAGGPAQFSATTFTPAPSVPDSMVVRSTAGYGDPTQAASAAAGQGSRVLWRIGFGVFSVAALVMVAALLIRFLLAGRMPVSNLYESITFAMGGFAIASLTFEAIYRQGWIGCAASAASTILMSLANSLPLQMRKVEPLVAVLNNYWLNWHVTSLLISYSLFLIAFVFAIMFFVKEMTGDQPGILPGKEMFEYLAYRAIQVGWPLLTIGILLGAVWANTAWGNAWSWDPKETWALITWFTYTIYLHLRMNLGWTGRRSVVASIVGFVMVLVTYFGVSYLPGLSGGMHSYAEPIKKG